MNFEQVNAGWVGFSILNANTIVGKEISLSFTKFFVSKKRGRNNKRGVLKMS